MKSDEEREAAMINGEHVARIFDGDKENQAFLVKVNKNDFSITRANGERIRFDLAMLLMGGAPG